jgi:hypothetical protein
MFNLDLDVIELIVHIDTNAVRLSFIVNAHDAMIGVGRFSREDSISMNALCMVHYTLYVISTSRASLFITRKSISEFLANR